MPTNVIMPSLGLTMTEGTVIQWFAGEGDQVVKGQPLFEVMTDKAVLVVESPASGILASILVGAGQVAPVAATIGVIVQPGEEVAAPTGEVLPPVPKADRVFASPRAKKLAKEQGIPLDQLVGTGPGGRIVARDVLHAAPTIRATPLAARVAAASSINLNQVTGTGVHGKVTRADVMEALRIKEESVIPPPSTKSIPMAGIRKIIAERMSYSKQVAPHVTLTTEADMTEIVKLHHLLSPVVEEASGKPLTYSEILVKVVARALVEHPEMNATLQADSIQLLSEVHVGLAAAVDHGLVVPVIHYAHTKTLTEIAVIVKSLLEKARKGKLLPGEMTGGTFTVSNLGMYEIDAFTPIINPPETGILGVGRIMEKPVVKNGAIVACPVVTLSLSFDHRVIDGAPAARFLQKIKRLLENPLLLLA